MSGNSGNITVGDLVNVISAGVYLERRINFNTAEDMRTTLENVLADKVEARELWRCLQSFARSAIALRAIDIGLGGKVQR